MNPYQLSQQAWSAYMAGQYKAQRDDVLMQARMFAARNFRERMVKIARKAHRNYLKSLREALRSAV